MFFLVLLGVVTMAGIVYLAVSPKSSRTLKLVALGALALMILAIIISLFFIFGVFTTGGPKEPVLPDIEIFETPHATGPNIIALAMFGVFLVVLFILVVVLSFREKKTVKDKNDW